MTLFRPPNRRREAALVMLSMAVVGLLAPPLVYGLVLVVLHLRWRVCWGLGGVVFAIGLTT